MAACSLSLILFVSIFLALIARKLFRASNPASLRTKHVLITGGSSGIGKAVAMEASRLGAHVTILSRDEDRLREAVEEIKKAAKHPTDQKIRHFSMDVTEGLTAAEEALERAEAASGPILVLVNCVGVAFCAEFDTATESDFRHAMETNYLGTVFPTVCAAKRMKERKEGHVVITGSQASLLGIYGTAAYAPSKFALRGFAESLAAELKPHDVSVTFCIPPDVDTPGFAALERSKPKATKSMSEIGELFRPEDVARQLLSDAMRRKFFSSLGLEGLALRTLCAGMSPADSAGDVLLQVSMMGLLRLVAVGYLLRYRRVIRAHVHATAAGEDAKKVG